MISNKSAVHYNADDMVTIVMDIDMQIQLGRYRTHHRLVNFTFFDADRKSRQFNKEKLLYVKITCILALRVAKQSRPFLLTKTKYAQIPDNLNAKRISNCSDSLECVCWSQRFVSLLRVLQTWFIKKPQFCWFGQTVATVRL